MSSLSIAAAAGGKNQSAFATSAFGKGRSAFSAHRSHNSSPFSVSSSTSSIRQRPSPVSMKPMCKFYARGYCSRGSSCRFRHEDNETDNILSVEKERKSEEMSASSSGTGGIPLCSFFIRGTCRRGSSCRFRHEPQPIHPPPPEIVTTNVGVSIRPQPLRRSSSMRRTAPYNSRPPKPPLDSQVKKATSLDRSLEGIRARVAKCREAVDRAEKAAAVNSAF
mmetsp:Transcript_9815/g.13154  ORF Transcript_9815/g.13154 Transcript_9815/m.13154 type:complete len:221 (+) Transcript_9815:264-926(+)